MFEPLRELDTGKVEGGGGVVAQVPGERLAHAVGGTKVPKKCK